MSYPSDPSPQPPQSDYPEELYEDTRAPAPQPQSDELYEDTRAPAPQPQSHISEDNGICARALYDYQAGQYTHT